MVKPPVLYPDRDKNTGTIISLTPLSPKPIPFTDAMIRHFFQKQRRLMMIKPYYWWPLQTILCLISLSFAMVGIYILVAAYGLKDPASFVMAFFSASFIILTGLALFTGLVIRMVKRHYQHDTSPAAEGIYKESINSRQS